MRRAIEKEIGTLLEGLWNEYAQVFRQDTLNLSDVDSICRLRFVASVARLLSLLTFIDASFDKCQFGKYSKSSGNVLSIVFLQSRNGEYVDVAESFSRNC